MWHSDVRPPGWAPRPGGPRITARAASGYRRGSMAGAPVFAPGEPARLLLEDGPDVGGVIDDVQGSDALVGGEFQNVDHIEAGPVPAGQLPVEAEPDADQRCAVGRGAL